MIELNKNQIERLYMVFDFEDYEEIVSAILEENQLTIHYLDNRYGVKGTYLPYFAKYSQEDKEKLDFILNGMKLKRNC